MHFRILAPLVMAATVAAQTSGNVTPPITTASSTSVLAPPSSLPPTAASSSLAQPSATPGPSNQTILEILSSNITNLTSLDTVVGNLPQNSTFLDTVLPALNSTGNYTIFVPSNMAFLTVNRTLINSTYGGWENVLYYHIVNQTITSANLTTSPTFFNTLLTNSSLSKFPNNEGLPIGLVRNTKVGGQSLWSGLRHAITGTGNNNGTIEIGYGYDQYGNVMTNNVTASNGIIYFVDNVLLPPVSPSQTLAKKNSVDMLISELNEHNLTDTLNNATGVTFFVPTDQAIRNANLSQYDNNTLAVIFKNHVVQGVFFTSNITQNSTATSLAGNQLTFANVTYNATNTTNHMQEYHLLKRLFMQDSDTKYTVNNATIVDKNILTNNGVAHIIDQVLIPQNITSNNTNGTTGGNGTAPGSGAAITGTSHTALLVALAVSVLLI